MSQSDKRTALGVVLAHLQAGQGLTQKLVWDEHGISRLAAIVDNLKRKGVDIDSEWLSVDSRYGKTRVKRYFLAAGGDAQ